jgi:hypothetical protein
MCCVLTAFEGVFVGVLANRSPKSLSALVRGVVGENTCRFLKTTVSVFSPPVTAIGISAKTSQKDITFGLHMFDNVILLGAAILRRDPLGFGGADDAAVGFSFEEPLRLLVISISRFINGRFIVEEVCRRIPVNRLVLDEDGCTPFLSICVAHTASVTMVSLLGPRILDSSSLTRASISIGLLRLARVPFSGAKSLEVPANNERSNSDCKGSSSPPHLDQSLSMMSGKIGR